MEVEFPGPGSGMRLLLSSQVSCTKPEFPIPGQPRPASQLGPGQAAHLQVEATGERSHVHAEEWRPVPIRHLIHGGGKPIMLMLGQLLCNMGI